MACTPGRGRGPRRDTRSILAYEQHIGRGCVLVRGLGTQDHPGDHNFCRPAARGACVLGRKSSPIDRTTHEEIGTTALVSLGAEIANGRVYAFGHGYNKPWGDIYIGDGRLYNCRRF